MYIFFCMEETREPNSGPTYIRDLGAFKNAYELLNLRAIQITILYKNHIFQYMGKIFCVEFKRVPLKFHTKYLINTLKDLDLFTSENSRALRFKSSKVFLKRPLHFECLKWYDCNPCWGCRKMFYKQIAVKLYSKFKHFHSRKCILKVSSGKCRPFCFGLNKLKLREYYVMKYILVLFYRTRGWENAYWAVICISK